MAAKKANVLEESFEKLDTIINRLENSELSLEESFQLYNEGIKLVKSCNTAIDKVEKKLIILNDN